MYKIASIASVLALVLVGGLAFLGLAGGEDTEPLAEPDPTPRATRIRAAAGTAQ